MEEDNNKLRMHYTKFIILIKTSVMPALRSEFLCLENISYRQQLRVNQLIALKPSVFNFYQRISHISLEKEKIKSKLISINGDLIRKKN